MKGKYKIFFLPLCLGLLTLSCTKNLTKSPNPGVFMLILTNNPGRFTPGEDDSLMLQISQVRVYRANGDYARIYERLDSYRDQIRTVNGFELNEDKPDTIGETYLPPEQFTEISLTVNLAADDLTLNGQRFPVSMPDSINPVVRLEHNFRIEENKTTEVELELQADSSLIQESFYYIFKPVIRVVK